MDFMTFNLWLGITEVVIGPAVLMWGFFKVFGAALKTRRPSANNQWEYGGTN